MASFIEFSPEVINARNKRKPILGLESTLITHGLPYPQNLETAEAAEAVAREMGVTPATIAIMRGKLKIGLTADDLKTLVNEKNVIKASSNDIAWVLSQNLIAGTTVAATLYCTALADIKVMATGGIGGVHRGQDMDISADLIALAKTPIALICSGAKSILDIPKTLELLETLSIPIIGFGTEYFPAFYSVDRRHRLDMHTDNIKILASVIQTQRQLTAATGILIANPILEQDQIPMEKIDPIIEEGVKKAHQLGIRSKEMTPFLLQELNAQTSGETLRANIALIKNNVRLGAQLAAMV